ncbi:MAG: TonB-dependent receptor [Flavobacteriales bacterium]
MTLRSFRSLLILAPLLYTAQITAQGTTQTVRGTILDTDTRLPLFGATVEVKGVDPALSTMTDQDGGFVIKSVPTGRIDVVVSVFGYEAKVLANLLVISSKETVLQVPMLTSVKQLNEAKVSGKKRKGQARNDMATVSARRISVEETSRIAGGINDPARMVGTFAGVASTPDGNNTIVVRGNSPKGVQWRLEGMEIPNPNHFSDDGSTGGPINVLNSDMIDDSDFLTGAFSAEYGNVYSAVFDMRLRDGNNKKREYTLKAGVLGTDLTVEGPLPGVESGSYLANYRYSTLALLDGAGIVDYQGVPKYTDAAFKVKVPTTKAGTFSLFGVGGRSSIQQEDIGVTGDTLFARNDYRSRMGVVGLSHTRTLGANSYLYSTVSMSGNGSGNEYFEAPAPGEDGTELRSNADLAKWTLRATTTLNTRLNAKHKLRTGILFSNDHFRMLVDDWNNDSDALERELDRTGSANTTQAFVSHQWRWNERWTLTSGVHLLHYDLNDAIAAEPRVALRYQQRPDQAFTFGAGLHSKTQSLMTLQVQDFDAQGNVVRPNEQLGLTRAAHAVVGYERMLAEDIQLKVEGYYQYLYDLPVENNVTSAYSESNTIEWFSDRALVNEGVGYNTGIELSVEKFFTRGYHFLATGSFSETKYQALDGVWHNSRFNLGTVANVLAGKEWKIRASRGKDRVFMAGFRWSMQGGQYHTPIDLKASRAAGEQVLTNDVWSYKSPDVHKLDVVMSYRVGRPKASHEFKVDVQNVMNAQTPVGYFYEDRTGTIKSYAQLSILPVVQYTLRF